MDREKVVKQPSKLEFVEKAVMYMFRLVLLPLATVSSLQILNPPCRR
jgi:hypothetical protein